MNLINPQSLTQLDPQGRPAATQAPLLAPGESLSATVRQVAQDQLQPGVFRVRLEADNRLLELKTPQPLTVGIQVKLSRDSGGQLTLSLLPSAPAPATTATNPRPDQSPLHLQAHVSPAHPDRGEMQRLLQLIPAQAWQPARVIAQSPPPGQQPPPAGVTQAVGNRLAGTPPNPTPSPNTSPLAQTQAQAATPYTQPAVPSPPAATQQPTTTYQPLPPSGGAQPDSAQPNTRLTQLAAYTSATSTSVLQLALHGQVVDLRAPANLPVLQQLEIGRQADQLLIRWSPSAETPHLAAPREPAVALTKAQLALLHDNLKEQLPRQQPLADSLQQLSQLNQIARQNTDSASRQVDKLTQTILQLFGIRPGSANAEQQVRQNIQLGGLFTEQRLAQQQPPQQDLKQLLGKLQASAEQLPAQQRDSTLQLVDKMLARVTSQQLQAALPRAERADHSNTERVFQLDLPIYQTGRSDNVELRIGQEQRTNQHGQPETIWSARLNFDLQQAGKVTAEVALNAHSGELSAAFICQQVDTTEHLRQQLQPLQAILQQAGFNQPLLTCRQGQPNPAKGQAIQRKLVDVTT